MKSLRFAALILALVLMAAACADDTIEPDESGLSGEQTVRFYVGPDVVECEGSAPQECLQVSETGHENYEYFYDSIDGFEHVPGTQYVLDVAVSDVADPPADGSSKAYRLLDIVEQESP